MTENLEQILKQFTDEATAVYGASLLSLVLYGSAASSEYVEGRSNINCLVLLNDVTPDELKKCSALLPEWHKRGFSTPLFIDPLYVRSSVDVFPLEFLDMKQRYRLLFGQDFLKNLEVSRQRLRFQCEQELKGKMLKLRQLYLEASPSAPRIVSLLAKSSSSFMILLRALIYLQRMPAPSSAENVLGELAQLGLHTEAIAKVYALKRRADAISETEIDNLFRQYLGEIQVIVEFVDKMNVEAP